MNMRRMPFVMLLTVSALAVACSDPPAVETPPQPTSEPAPTAAPTAAETAAPTATAAATAAPTATAAVEAPPPPKPAKEKIVGKWQFSFEGEPKAKAEEAAKKKFPNDKDQAKRDAEIKKIEEAAAGEWIEFADGYYVSHVTEKGKDKVVAKMKYDVVKDESTSLTIDLAKAVPERAARAKAVVSDPETFERLRNDGAVVLDIARGKAMDHIRPIAQKLLGKAVFENNPEVQTIAYNQEAIAAE